MKKLLLATVAFVLLAPVARAEIKLDLGGYFKGYAGYSDQDTDGLRSFDIKRKSQVHFTGETTLDNGLTVGYNGQLFQENDLDGAGVGSDAKLEQSYLFFSGNWGRFNLGRENGAAYLLQVSAPSADPNIDGMDADFSFFNRIGSVREDYKHAGPRNEVITSAGGFSTVDARDQQYADKITYLTPKFNGFQAGVSYSPSLKPTVNNYVPGGQGLGVGAGNPGYFGMETDGDVGQLEQLIEGAARYDTTFGNFGLHLGGGYSFASAEESIGTGDDKFDQYNIGLKLNYKGFGIGGSYLGESNPIQVVGIGPRADDTNTWIIGADYTAGAYNFGASYLTSEGNLFVAPGDDELTRFTVGAGYTFGPGMKFNGSFSLYGNDAEASPVTLAPAASNDAFAIAIGTDIQF